MRKIRKINTISNKKNIYLIINLLTFLIFSLLFSLSQAKEISDNLPNYSPIFNLFKVNFNNLKDKNNPKDKDIKIFKDIKEKQKIFLDKKNFKKPKIKIISEIMCPYCKILIKNFLKPLLKIKNWHKLLDLDIIFFGNSRSKFNPKEKSYIINCPNGEKECLGNSILTCAKKFLDKTFYLNYIVCIEEYTKNFDYEKSNKFCLKNFPKKLENIEKCVKSPFGSYLFHKEILKSPKNRYVPYVYINGIQNEKKQIEFNKDFKGLLCNMDYNRRFNSEICEKILPLGAFKKFEEKKEIKDKIKGLEIKGYKSEKYEEVIIQEFGRFKNEKILEGFIRELIKKHEEENE